MKILFKYPTHHLLPYEKEFSIKEVENLFKDNTVSLTVEKDHIVVLTSNQKPDAALINKFKSLVHFVEVSFEGNIVNTYQGVLESSCPRSGKSKRQSTRYGAHSLHEYKGKFNPQIVASILQLLDLEKGSKILEPFCGSGTTVYESTLKKHSAIGFDFNPLAVYIANTKLASLGIKCNECREGLKRVIEKAKEGYSSVEIDNSAREEYLKKWFDIEQLKKIESLYSTVKKDIRDVRHKDILLCLASDLIREYSLQEPADLRIRRRKAPMPSKCFFEVLTDKVNAFLDGIDSLPENEVILPSKAYNIDIRDTDKLKNYLEFDGAITSPPYATALPYIDTQRLSLIWLEFATPKEVKALENSLIGSREMLKKEERELRRALESNSSDLPEFLHSLCLDMLSSLTDKDGFRRQAMPFIIYRYFSDMKKMFENVLFMLKKKGRFALVVGHNQTTLSGKLFDLDTPEYLVILGTQLGWKIKEKIKLDVYKRYDLHKANSINYETLIIFEK